jgi:AhpD family alkylhydroperoxidase
MERISLNDAPQGMLQVVLNVENYISKSEMDEKLLDLLRVRVSQINSCAYCLDMHYKEAIHAGETEKSFTLFRHGEKQIFIRLKNRRHLLLQKL